MPSIDTVLTTVGAETALTSVTVAAGDSLTVRNFAPPATAVLDDMVVDGTASTTAALTSPYLHDTTRGITVITAASPGFNIIPTVAPQSLSPQDTLRLQAFAGASAAANIALINYYSDLGASNARLYSLGDVSGLIVQIKPLEVAITTSATVGAWNSAVFTTTENLLKANTDYAVLGYILDVACTVVGLVGQDTGSLKITGPGSTDTDITTSYFVDKANSTGRPYIPVVNAANVGNTSIVAAANTASVALKPQLILAELSSNLR